MSVRALIEFDGVALGYASKIVLGGLDFSLEPGDFLGIVGPNGSGKTTILRGILGLLQPTAGTIRLRDDRIHFGYVPQRQSLDEIYPLSTRDVIAMGLYHERGLDQVQRSERIDRAMRWTGIAEHADALFRQLSGGQKQRVLIARALTAAPDVLVLDEPTSGMDLAGESSVMELIAQLHRERGVTIILVSHQLNTVARWVRSIGLLHDGRLDCGSVDEILNSQRLAEVYGDGARVVEVDGLPVVLPPKGQA